MSRLFFVRNFFTQFKHNDLKYNPLFQSMKCSQSNYNSLIINTLNYTFKFQFKNFSTNSGKQIQKIKSSKGEFKRLFRLAYPERWKLAGALTFLIVSSSVTMAVPFSLGKVIDIIYTRDSADTKKNLEKVCYILLGIFLIGGVCNFGRVYIMQNCGQRITQTLRKDVYGAIIKQDIAFFDKNKTGELINRLSADTSLVSSSVTMNISDGLRSTFMACAGVSMMFYVSPKLAFVGLSIVPPIAVLAVAYGRYVRKITKKVQDGLAGATQLAEERISNIRTVRAFGRENNELTNYQKKIDHVLGLIYNESLAKGLFFGMTGLSGNFIILSVLYYGGTMVTQEAISIGSLSAFLLYAAYVGISIGGLSSFYSELMKGLGASTRLWELIDREPKISLAGGIVPSSIDGNIIIKNASFAYPSRKDSLIFSNLNLIIPSGTIVAIVGGSGTGKSTIVSLLLRYYNLTSGKITLDDRDISTLDPFWLKQAIGTVSQEPVLFSCSIKDNILYGSLNPEEVTEEQLIKVSKEANAYEFIMKFPNKFDTLVGERGIMLSGGQKQRVAIARALIKDPKILIFDEAMSAQDAESEALVREALERVTKNRTVISIAHRLSTIKNADKIAVLHQGAFVEIGSYEELIGIENGIFKKLVDKQTVKL